MSTCRITAPSAVDTNKQTIMYPGRIDNVLQTDGLKFRKLDGYGFSNLLQKTIFSLNIIILINAFLPDIFINKNDLRTYLSHIRYQILRLNK